MTEGLKWQNNNKRSTKTKTNLRTIFHKIDNAIYGDFIIALISK